MSRPEPEPFEVAIVGCGGLGRQHATCIREIDGLTTTAYCDLDPARAAALHGEFGGRYATAEVDRVLADDRVDVVYVTTHHDSHVDLCVRALAAGKHVLVEKPLAMTLDQCAQVRKAARASDRRLMVGFKFRYFDMVAKARELIAEPIVLSMQNMDQRFPDDHWANDPVRGGGNVLSQGVHAADLLRFAAGRDPIDVYAAGRSYYQATGVVDNIAAVVRFDGGVTASWLQGDADCPPVPGKFFLQLFEEGRSVSLNDRLTTLVYHERGRDPVTYHGSETGFLEESRALAAALRDPAAETPDVDDGVYATVMVLQAFASLTSQQPEPVRAAVEALG